MAAVPKLHPLLFEPGEFDLTVLERAVIAAPGEQAVRPGDRMAGEGTDDDQRQRRHCDAPYKAEAALGSPHEKQGITKLSRRQGKMDEAVDIPGINREFSLDCTP